MESSHSYSEFRESVKANLKQALSVFKLSDDEIEKYVAQEEDEIKSGYEHFLNPSPRDDRKEDVRFSTAISTVSYCLQMCY